ncbi:MAG: cytochrome c [Rhodospirillales bacterium]|nr:cytochrome c [Rhodospirillales bacterium]
MIATIFSIIAILIAITTTQSRAFDSAHEAELLNLLVQDCGSCHGLTMKGGLGSALLPENMIERDSEFLADIILEGIPETPMPPWKSQLSREEALWIVEKLKQGLKP